MGITPVEPPKANRKVKRDYDRELYKLRNEVKRLFRRLYGYRLISSIYSRFDKLNAMFPGVLNFALVVET